MDKLIALALVIFLVFTTLQFRFRVTNEEMGKLHACLESGGTPWYTAMTGAVKCDS
jgi:hypothetical protein